MIVGGNYQRDLRVYIGSFDEISPFWIYFSFFVWRNPNVISEDLWHLKFLLCVWAVSVWIWISACAMSFVLQFHFMKYEKYIRSCDLACLRQYHKWKRTPVNLFIDTYLSCYGLQVKDIWKRGSWSYNVSIHCAYWTKEKLSCKEFIFYVYLHYRNSIPKWKERINIKLQSSHDN